MTALKINQLNKTYRSGVVALKNVDLTVEEGDFFGLLGPNGAGKSTLIGIVTSLVNKSSGSVSIMGIDIEQDFSRAKAMIGLVPQEINFNHFETIINIVVTQAGFYGVPKKLAMERAEYYLKKMDLWEKRYSHARDLSGGMKRRLMLARALLHEPRLLILDEPTAGVDTELRRSLWDFLHEINQQGRTIILTTHYLEEAEAMCKNIAIMDKGNIIENANTKTLLTKLNSETFVLDLRHPQATLPNLQDFKTRLLDSKTLEVDVIKSQSLNQLFVQLSQHNIEIVSLRNKTNRLEELFLKLTGKNDVLQS